MNQIHPYTLAGEKEIYTTIGSRLRYFRLSRGMDQRALAVAAGVSRSTISKIECHWKYKPYSIGTFIKLARALEIPLEALLTDRDLSESYSP